MNAKDAARLAHRHAAVALGSYRDHHLDDELAAEGGPWTADEREQLDVELEKIQAYLEDVADPPGPGAFDHLPADHPAPVTTLEPLGLGVSPRSWVADAVAMEERRARDARGPDLNGAPDTGYCAPAIGVHVEPHRGCVMR